MSNFIKYEKPITISEVRKTVKGDFKPYFGLGTKSGELYCPGCGQCLGHLLSWIDIEHLDNTKIIGYINLIHIHSKCENSDKKLDLSDLRVRDLNTNAIPSDIDSLTWEEKVIGPGMIYNNYLGIGE